MKTKMVLVVRKDLNMRKGKVGAQCGHAASGILLDGFRTDPQYFDNGVVNEWLTSSFRKICVYVNSEEELDQIEQNAMGAGLTTKMIVDQGHTEFHGVPTKTVLAIGPDYCDKIDAVTGHLPLY